MPAIKIGNSIFEKLDYDSDMSSKNVLIADTPAAGAELVAPTVLLVFAKSDLNAAAYHLAKSLESPFSDYAIATVLVEEAARIDFIARLQPLLRSMAPAVAQHAGRQQALSVIAQHKWDTVVAAALGPNSPTLVCDVTHEQLGVGATGIATLHTFRTAKEAISLCGKESLEFVSASIWHGNQASAYEVALGSSCANYFINCNQISLAPLNAAKVAENGSCAILEQSYHYETLMYKGVRKNIVFPIGTIFAN